MAIQKRHSYTYQDWLEYDQNENTISELIDGHIFMMAPPSRRHQAISRTISTKLATHLAGKRCKVYYSPFAVRLEEDTVVEPDIVVICDPKKLTNAGCSGAPDLIIEILSPSSIRHDKYTKFMLYLRTGVQEYWIVDPDNNAITVCRLAEKGYITTVLTETETATITVLPGFELNLSEVFQAE